MFYKDFQKKNAKQVFHTETKPGVFEKNSKFKLKSNWEADTVNKIVEAFGWRVRDRINEMIESTIHNP